MKVSIICVNRLCLLSVKHDCELPDSSLFSPIPVVAAEDKKPLLLGISWRACANQPHAEPRTPWIITVLMWCKCTFCFAVELQTPLEIFWKGAQHYTTSRSLPYRKLMIPLLSSSLYAYAKCKILYAKAWHCLPVNLLCAALGWCKTHSCKLQFLAAVHALCGWKDHQSSVKGLNSLYVVLVRLRGCVFICTSVAIECQRACDNYLCWLIYKNMQETHACTLATLAKKLS